MLPGRPQLVVAGVHNTSLPPGVLPRQGATSAHSQSGHSVPDPPAPTPIGPRPGAYSTAMPENRSAPAVTCGPQSG
jgi:hypothetical protein